MHESTGLWTRAYFLRQAAKVGPGCVEALTRLLDSRTIEAQGFRSCMNILDLGKRGNKSLLEQACTHLVGDGENRRPVSYTAVKNRITALRAGHDHRPGTRSAATPSGTPLHPAAVADRDTSRAYLAGAGAFSLDALLGKPAAATGEQEDRDA